MLVNMQGDAFSMTTIRDLLTEFSKVTDNNRNRGMLFERLISNYLKTDPQYTDRLSDVWLWSEWPEHRGADVGIDLVARERGTGDYWAIQCKFFDLKHSIQKADIDSFFTASGKRFQTKNGKQGFSQRLIISTTDEWSPNAQKALEDQSIPVSRICLKDLNNSPIDWSQFSPSHPEKLRLKPKKKLMEHQIEAIRDVINGFKEMDRGKLIMACGTGKTFTTLRLAEQIVPEGGHILFLTPSISLVSQSLREWTSEAIQPIHAFVVCSDTKAGKDKEDLPIHDLAYPATTDARKLINAVKNQTKDRHTVIFSTYQSIQVLSKAQQHGLAEFDLIICDEAHRTAGLTLPDEKPSMFVKVHDNDRVRSKKRIYMTATPRIYADTSKNRANEVKATLFSMDNEKFFGREFHRLGFGNAVNLDLLSEYKVLIVAVDESEMAKLANNYNNIYKIDNRKAIDTLLATEIIGSWKGLSKQGLVLIDEKGQKENLFEDISPMHRAVAFSNSIKKSKQIREIFTRLIEIYQQSDVKNNNRMINCTIEHVDGTMNAQVRQNKLDWLKNEIDESQCNILSNARCLSEGIDVPTLDAVVFFDTRESLVDIVQSVGRVMRKADGKKYGYIILPVCIPSEEIKDYNTYIENDPQFKGIWKVLKALRAHDESLVDEAEFRNKIKVISFSHRKHTEYSRQEQLLLDFPMLPIDAISQAVYAAIPKKFGDREYWSEWAKDISNVAEHLIVRIKDLITYNSILKKEFAAFLKGLQDTINPAVTDKEAIEMLAQHILTLPIFEALFAGNNFSENNPVAKALQAIVKKFDAAAVASETGELEKFYLNIRERISYAKCDKTKQDIIRNLYDTFFQNAFPHMAERLGIVYTPVPIVDFIINSVQFALKKHFKCNIGDKGVQILDPFCGTGTFLVRLIQSSLISSDNLVYKFKNELHANEIVLLAYYIATVNIETAFHEQTGMYNAFRGMVLADTFQMTEENDHTDKVVLPENNERAERQRSQPIRVIFGNPPYFSKQNSANDDNKNINYPTLDNFIQKTYAEKSTANLVKNLYDSYIRAIRWASNRIFDKGIVAFVTNGSFLDANNMDGLRKCLTQEYSTLYVFNLRGNARTQGEERRKEGGGIFGEGSRTPVAITIMIKDPTRNGPCKLHYYDIGDYLTKKEKFEIIAGFRDIGNINWQTLTPNIEGDWVNQRDPIFDNFIPLGEKSYLKKENKIFDVYSSGVVTGRDAWTYNMNRRKLTLNINKMINIFNTNSLRYKKLCCEEQKNQNLNIESTIDINPKHISWTRALKTAAKIGKKYKFEKRSITKSMYRPFTKEWLYFSNCFNEVVSQMPKLFPTLNHNNVVISITGVGIIKKFSCLVTNIISDFQMQNNSQCFSLYWYEKIDNKINKKNIISSKISNFDGYIRHNTITDWALNIFREHYIDKNISKEDIFWYIYGILHSPEYKQRFAANLKKMLPRIPFAKNFHEFCDSGRKLGKLHLNYEIIEPYSLKEEKRRQKEKKIDYRVSKMVFNKKDGKPDKSVIIYNEHIVLRDIPLEAYDYVVNGKSAIEWIMDRYQFMTDKASGITNDPNEWSDNPRYIIDLLKRIVRVSVESVRIVKNLPPLQETIRKF